MADVAAPSPGEGRSGSRAVQRRLWSLGGETRVALALAVLAGAAGAGLVVLQAGAVSTLIAGAFLHGLDLRAATPLLVVVVLVALGRGLLAWASPVLGQLAATRVRARLRGELAGRLLRLPPAPLAGTRTGSVVQAATAGIDALDGYYARYLPQLALAVAVPLLVVVVTLRADLLSGIVLLVTLPLLPLFLWLVGVAAAARSRRRQRALDELGGHFLDVLRGLPTLRCFNRGGAQAAQVAAIAERYRRATMSTLRLAFTSALVLELAAMVSTALVAVEVGLRVDAGALPLGTAFFVLLLVPEAFLPLRQAGVQFHAASDATAAAERIFELLDAPVRPEGRRPPSAPPRAVLRLERVTVRYAGRAAPALAGASLEVRPGERVVLAGPSGGGKTTILHLLLGLEAPAAGCVTVGGVDLADLDPAAWRRRIAWLPQEARLAHGTVEENVRWGDPSASEAAVAAALTRAGLAPAELAQGLATPAGEAGGLLSAGQRRRVALARALVRASPLLLLDEPAANLDVELAATVGDLIGTLPRDVTVVFAAHEPALLRRADRVLHVAEGVVR